MGNISLYKKSAVLLQASRFLFDREKGGVYFVKRKIQLFGGGR
jgi:hypothetical protein